MPSMPGDLLEVEAGLRQMTDGWQLNQAILWLIVVAACVTLISIGGATLLALRGPHPSH